MTLRITPRFSSAIGRSIPRPVFVRREPHAAESFYKALRRRDFCDPLHAVGLGQRAKTRADARQSVSRSQLRCGKRKQSDVARLRSSMRARRVRGFDRQPQTAGEDGIHVRRRRASLGNGRSGIVRRWRSCGCDRGDEQPENRRTRGLRSKTRLVTRLSSTGSALQLHVTRIAFVHPVRMVHACIEYHTGNPWLGRWQNVDVIVDRRTAAYDIW